MPFSRHIASRGFEAGYQSVGPQFWIECRSYWYSSGMQHHQDAGYAVSVPSWVLTGEKLSYPGPKGSPGRDRNGEETAKRTCGGCSSGGGIVGLPALHSRLKMIRSTCNSYGGLFKGSNLSLPGYPEKDATPRSKKMCHPILTNKTVSYCGETGR